MIKLTGTQRELMEILWENGQMTLHALTKAALGNAVTPNRTDAIRVVLLQMVTKKAVSEDATVSPHIYTPIVDRSEVGFESGFVDAAKAEGNALLTALSCRERDEYEAEKARKKAEEEAKAADAEKEEE